MRTAAARLMQTTTANLRFTGTPTGNVTVTFPAWAKRYSIINDCAGDGAIICTTGNGESVSIKNGAKYEVGCDGKNLTISTVNASQLFAEANKNISALDAPTVQQLLTHWTVQPLMRQAIST
ncbi:Mn2+ and Fe2+ transporters of the NRAMP family [Zymobacter palmae]|uniref:Mn2+ and Fe2+ transporters of the NRAMP family n=2 Tax=Zymobacter palmae TaxID=33074 RepID=A0A348HFG6_9GAMM|nr:Mn2+ and Fe2+ transporters of the NRAMP family [Zymobacter palmae]